MPAHSTFPAATLESICRVLADTSSGLTGTEIGRLLQQLGIGDPFPGLTKWRRLMSALDQRQTDDRCGNKVIEFILEAMRPVRFAHHGELFEERCAALNGVLVFSGLELLSDGNLARATAARTLDEARQRAGRLRAELMKRKVHPEVLAFCRAELLQNNHFHAVLEATKSVSQKIRDRTGLTGDAGELAEKALALGKTGMPFLAFNTLQTDSEKSEQKGLMNLMVGFFGTFRNTTAHAPKVTWAMSEQDALDLLTMASFLHHRLDAAARTPRAI
ncbi:TIGR02391 family protein [Haloferula sargassicola]|uniref:Conserved hypothetical protein CHP02391 domain-containing protein n=1 Tax=Haloferula sargassicola TaxID=490096 RepID=A0ABP9UR22_9BACT